mgnify:CR=1 FL=1
MDKSTEYIRGSKRLKIIQNYLNGREDPAYEVLPTRKEGKYIVTKQLMINQMMNKQMKK